MCGFSGKLNFDLATSVPRGLIQAMNRAMAHRGPDDEGVYVEGPIGLGHRRLAILDLSSAGHQPMSNATKTHWIVFNGEIYNYRLLRKILEQQGCRFKSSTDTEVILALYQRDGVGCLKHLRGMFAFALWDAPHQRLFLARDRLGKKPLKYAITPQGITFASELKALFKDPFVPREVDECAVHDFLSLQYVPSPRTGFKGIQKLPQAHYLLWEKGTTLLKRYWQLDFQSKQERTEEEWEERVVDSLRESVALRLISDVPVGVFLSGGIDSSIVTTLMAEASSEPVKTFSIRFDEKQHDEAAYIHRLVQTLKTDHREWVLKPDVIRHLPELVEMYEEPYADPAALPTWLMSAEVSKVVKVALNGDGGDENFAGYRAYRAYQWDATCWQKIPLVLRRILHAWIKGVSKGIQSAFIAKLAQFMSHPELSAEARFFQSMCFFTEEQKEDLYTSEFKAATQEHRTRELLENVFQEVLANDPLDRVLAVDIQTHLPDNLLVKVDLGSMAHGLETRSPFLDHEFMEMTAQMPSHLKGRPGIRKYLLKKAFQGKIPHEILHRPKQGFDLPLEGWFRNELKTYAQDILLSPSACARGLFKKEALEKFFQDHVKGKHHVGRQIWALLTLELWYKTYVDG